MDNEADAKRQSAQDFLLFFFLFPQDQCKSEWNKSWKVGFKARDCYGKQTNNGFKAESLLMNHDTVEMASESSKCIGHCGGRGRTREKKKKKLKGDNTEPSLSSIISCPDVPKSAAFKL